MSKKPLALCSRAKSSKGAKSSKSSHILAWKGKHDGEDAIIYSGGISTVSPRNRNWQIQEDFFLKSKTSESAISTTAVCPCGYDFDLHLNELAQVWDSHASPLVLQPNGVSYDI
jgi:hypothetical protein